MVLVLEVLIYSTANLLAQNGSWFPVIYGPPQLHQNLNTNKSSYPVASQKRFTHYADSIKEEWSVLYS
ncbi:hypothetical protein BGX28_000489 [Mortierella sp. GBA30]|nr:hypothetical protein BGX28_000489 [Mortierella sp. GBA30]